MIGLDSSVVIDMLRNKIPASKLNEFSEDVCTSEIVAYELLYGIYAAQNFSEQRLKEVEEALDAFVYIFPIERRAAARAAQISGKLSKAGQTIEHTDSLIAGSLIVNGCIKLVTKNVKDFSRIKELQILGL